MMIGNLWRRGWALKFLLICVLGLSHQLEAQQTVPAPPATPPTQTQTGDDSGGATAPAVTQPKTQQNDRIFWALPNYLTVENAPNLPPLTTFEKFKTVAQGCFDPVEAFFIGIQAGLDQADNVNPTYGQGLIGYSKRYGTAYADAIIGNFGTGAIFPALLRQDPRYFQLGKGRFLHRFVYAAGRVLITRSETTGKYQFNFSELLGNGLAAGLANTYHPAPHTIASSANVLGTQTLMDIAGYELKEFWPDIHHFVQRSRHKI